MKASMENLTSEPVRATPSWKCTLGRVLKMMHLTAVATEAHWGLAEASTVVKLLANHEKAVVASYGAVVASVSYTNVVTCNSWGVDAWKGLKLVVG